MKPTTIARFLNKELNIRKIPDSSKNGLQYNAKNEIKKVGFAVDATISTINLAKKEKVDLLIVHHGFKWKKHNFPEWSGKVISLLKKNKISLYGIHLPLDLHKKYGNNIQLAKMLELKNIKKFGGYHGIKIGYKGELKKTTDIKSLAKFFNKQLKTKTKILNFGKKKIKTIGMVSGGGSMAIPEVFREKLDCFLLGEFKHSDFHSTKDMKLNLLGLGHYASETVGVKALMPLIEKTFKVTTIFIDNPTGY